MFKKIKNGSFLKTVSNPGNNMEPVTVPFEENKLANIDPFGGNELINMDQTAVPFEENELTNELIQKENISDTYCDQNIHHDEKIHAAVFPESGIIPQILSRLSDLEDGWLGEESEAPSKNAITLVGKLLTVDVLNEYGLPEIGGGDGSVGIVWFEQGYYLDIDDECASFIKPRDSFDNASYEHFHKNDPYLLLLRLRIQFPIQRHNDINNGACGGMTGTSGSNNAQIKMK